MTAPALPGQKVRQRLDQALERLAAEIKRSLPNLHYSIQHGGNASFPWWIVARFSNGDAAGRVVDISIDCQETPDGWTIRADLARESGLVLQELSAEEMARSQNGEQPGSHTAEAVN